MIAMSINHKRAQAAIQGSTRSQHGPEYASSSNVWRCFNDSPVEWADGCELRQFQGTEVIRRLHPSSSGSTRGLSLPSDGQRPSRNRKQTAPKCMVTADDRPCMLHLCMQARLTLTAGLGGETPAVGCPRGMTGSTAGMQTRCRCGIAKAVRARRGGVCCAPVWRRGHLH